MMGPLDPVAVAPEGASYEPFDPGYVRDVVDEVFGPNMHAWFRPRVLGAHRLPTHGPVLLAGNHSGNAFPYDAMIVDALLWERDGFRPGLKFRSVFEKELALAWWMRPFGLDNFWRRCGGVDATFDNIDRLLEAGRRVIYYPEGVPGIGKGFFRRYELQRFSTSFVVLAARHDVPVHPLYIVNAEWIVPFCFTLRPVDWLVDRLLHVPFLPLPMAALGIAFPFAWYLAFPIRLVAVVGESIDVRGMLRKVAGVSPERAERAHFRAVADEIRAHMQRELDVQVDRHGARPYHARSLRRELERAVRERRLTRVLPTGWPAGFIRFERDRHRGPARSRLHALARDWDLVGFYLPFGWPVLSATRALRKPPYGYRGMRADERREREGAFVWKLAERPLPPL